MRIMSNTKPSQLPEIEELVATIACLYMGFEPNAYWKNAVNDQHPKALAQAKQQLIAREDMIRLEIANWAVHFVDKIEMDNPYPDDMWRTFKAIRNGMRDEYKRVYGVDPSPTHDPSKARLKKGDS